MRECFALDFKVNGVGFSVDEGAIAQCKVFYALIDAVTTGSEITLRNDAGLVDVGEWIKQTLKDTPYRAHPRDTQMRVLIVVLLARLVWSPCGTRMCGRPAALQNFDSLKVREPCV